MADVYTVTFIMIGILLSVPALLVVLNLFMPQLSARVHARLDQTPVKSFFLGLPITLFIIIYAVVMFGSNVGVLQTSAFIMAVFGLGLGSIGGAGMARMLGYRLAPLAQPNSNLTNLLRGAVVYEFACLVPVVGWFIFIPAAGITAIGAAAFALVGWIPKPKVSGNQPTIAGNPSA